MKKAIALFLVILLCITCGFSVYAESTESIQPRWKVLSFMGMSFKPYNGLYNNVQLITNASCASAKVRFELTTVVTKWNGSKYEDTNKTWSSTGYGAVEVSKTFRLDEGNYIVRTTVTLYDANGAYIETATVYSDELII